MQKASYKLKKTGRNLRGFMGKVFRALVALLVLAAIALVVYAYVGPIFGADFSAKQTEIRIPVELQGEE
ncbi:hypothetical protein J7413_07330 [Shimia sp. R10_1]|uniref:hypothetical protein n=1 Tax=Shimia sp. R10_1 TaxID=2821095 RepID=UPI001AD9E1B0|nr:hypothetical protein [Shimia sp. R10_1]MBO9473348.1 hypothetical protein [Shimia sp. R10_1]